MREYRKRKRLGQMSAPASLTSASSVVRAPEPSRVSRQKMERTGPQLVPARTGFARKAARSTLKTALDLARTFPFGSLASQVCPYTTPATVHPEHGAATVEVEKDESGGNWDSNGRFFDSDRRAGV
jgi:hypothetical protein